MAGEGIVEKRWTKKRKKDILESRTQPIDLIFSVLEKTNKKPGCFCFGLRGWNLWRLYQSINICTENTPPANDFLGITCQEWEKAVDKINSLSIRTVKIRTGIVLGKDEGFLKKIAPSFKAVLVPF